MFKEVFVGIAYGGEWEDAWSSNKVVFETEEQAKQWVEEQEKEEIRLSEETKKRFPRMNELEHKRMIIDRLTPDEKIELDMLYKKPLHFNDTYFKYEKINFIKRK